MFSRAHHKIAAVGLAILVLLAVALSACGESSPAALTHAEFMRETEGVCIELLGDRDPYLVVAQAPSTPAGREARIVKAKLLPQLRQGAAELAELTPPEKDERRVARLLVLFKKGIRTVAADPFTLVTGVAFAGAEVEFQKFGLAACSQI